LIDDCSYIVRSTPHDYGNRHCRTVAIDACCYGRVLLFRMAVPMFLPPFPLTLMLYCKLLAFIKHTQQVMLNYFSISIKHSST